MSKRIRMMIDDIFCEMKMTAENLALRDEMMANALERYEDNLAQGRSEDEAFAEVAASLGDVQALLEEIGAAEHAGACGAPEAEAQKEEINEEPDEAPEQTEEPEQPAGGSKQEGCQTDLGDALGKAFSALGDFGQAIVPEAKKFVGQMDDASGGMISKLGRATKKGLRDVQKAAGEAIDRLSGEAGELVFDFGPKSKPEEDKDTPESLRKQAQDLRAQAQFKEITGDTQNAQALREQADLLETQAAAIEQEELIKAAQADAQQEEKTAEQPLVGEDGVIDEQAFGQAVEDMAREAEEVVREAEQESAHAADEADEADYTVRDAQAPVSGGMTFAAAGLQTIDIQLDADDVEILPAQGDRIEVAFTAPKADCEPVIEMKGHTLTVRRKNPDVFKTFFSVFAKEGGKITLNMPRGYAPKYKIASTSGDVHISGVDADEVKISTTSGSVRVETDIAARADAVSVTTVSGHVTVSACADDIAATTVSGNLFISCDARRVDVNSVSGKVHVEGACDEWEISCVHSDAQLLCTVVPTGRIQVSSMQGTVRLALPGEIRGFVAEANGALGGKIVNEFGANRYGTCALPIRMDTLHGTLMITRL